MTVKERMQIAFHHCPINHGGGELCVDCATKVVTEAVADERERIAKKIDCAAQKYGGGSWAADLRELAAAIRKT